MKYGFPLTLFCFLTTSTPLLLSINLADLIIIIDFLSVVGPAEGEEESFTHQLRGVIPRAFEYLFSLINREQEKVSIQALI